MNKIAEKILADAQTLVDGINKDYEEKVRTAREEYEDTRQSLRIAYKGKLDELFQRELNQILALHTIEERKKILAAKWALIHELFAGLAEELGSNETLYSDFLAAMAFKGSISGSEQIIVSKKDQRFIHEDFLKNVNDKLYTYKGIDGMLKLSDDTRDIKGLLLAKDKINFNGTLASALAIVQRDHLPDIVKILFQTEDALQA